MTFQPLLENAVSLLGPVDLIDDLTFSNKAQVARLRMASGETVVAKRPVDPAAFARELQALRVLPAAVRPTLVAADHDLLIMEDLGTGPSLADLLLGRDPAAAEAAVMGVGGCAVSTMISTFASPGSGLCGWPPRRPCGMRGGAARP